MISQHCNWRTVEEWQHMNVPLSTPSNEASKMYDATLTQLVTYCNDPNIGGIETSIKNMLQADPNFVMGQAMSLGLRLYGGSSPRTNPGLKTSVEKLVKQAETQPHLAPSERQHVQAVQLLSDGHLNEACVVWDDILVDHPLDLLALRLAYLGYIYNGQSAKLRDSVARVLPHWSPSTPLYGYILGMHAFGLEETNLYDRAEKEAMKALEVNCQDPWSTHTLSHVFEMTGQQDRGIQFLDSTVKDWEVGWMLACHNWWHLALHHIEKGNYEQALEIFEKQVKTRCVKQRELFNVTDAVSLLFRLEMEGVNVASHWKDIHEISKSHLDEHTFAFNDVHLLLSCVGAGDKKAAQHMLESLEQFVREGQGTTRDVHGRVGLKMCQALAAYKDGDFAEAVKLVYPLRYEIFALGGSHAQRDVFHLFLIMSAIQSPKVEHHRLAKSLLAERKSFKENSPLTDRLQARVMALHGN